jgi:hypothetical protein
VTNDEVAALMEKLMKNVPFNRNLPAALAVLMMIATPMITATWPAQAARRGVAAACGPRGCAAVATRPAVRRGVVVVSPRRYWRPGGAIAAGAAIGFVTGATAAAIAGTPPRPGQCWYYTNSSKTTGFWDVCPK